MSGTAPATRRWRAACSGRSMAATGLSLLANVAPDEDLIETYRLFVLTNARNVGAGPLRSLVINIPGVASVDVIQNLFLNNTTWLSRKRAWVAACFT